MQKLYNWLAREDGQTMAEYGVVLAVITIAVFGALALLSGNIVSALEPRRRLYPVTRTDAPTARSESLQPRRRHFRERIPAAGDGVFAPH